MKKVFSFLVLLMLSMVLIACDAGMNPIFETTTEVSTEEPIVSDYLKQFSSEEDMVEYFEKMSQNSYKYGWQEDGILTPEAGVDNTADESEERHSETNVQVDGVSEMDTIITDGNYIYMAKNQELTIIDVLSMTVIYQSSLDDTSESDDIYSYGYYHGLYLYEDKLIVIYNQYQMQAYDNEEVRPFYDYWWGFGSSNVHVDVINVSNKEDIQIERSLEFKNTYLIDSRMIEDNMYLMMSSSSWWYEDAVVTPSYKDSILGEEFETLDYQDIYYFPDNDQVTSYLMIGSFSINEQEEVDLNAYLGYAYEVYMNQENLFISGHQYNYDEETGTVDQKTNISRFEIVDGKLVFRASNQIDGWTLNQFSFDEHLGVLRVATTDYEYNEDGIKLTNQLYLLDSTDDELTLISTLSGLGKPGERIYAVRMSGDIGYVVTFVNTDPLYKIDLSDPSNPIILGELYEDGVSDYLHPINDDYMIGIGRQADNSNGFTVFTGVKVALYDTTGDEPIGLQTLLVEGEYSFSPVTYDHKAFVEYEWNNNYLFAIPVYSYSYGYGEYYQAIYLYQVNQDYELVELAELRNSSDNDYYGYIEKAIFIGDSIYTISYTEINQFDMTNDFERTSTIVLKTIDNEVKDTEPGDTDVSTETNE